MSATDQVLDLLLSLTPADRERGAEEVADAASRLDDSQALTLAGALIVLWAHEDDHRIREAQLNALTALFHQVAVPKEFLAPLLQRRARAIGSEVDYFNEIDELARLRDR